MYFFQGIIKEHLTQFSSIGWCVLLLFFLSSCQQEKETLAIDKEEHLKHVHEDLLELRADEGLVYYNNKPFTGVAVSLYDKENMAGSIPYRDGIKQGIYKKWFKDGTLSFESNYKDGKQHGKTKTWWQNGKLRSESNFEQGIAHGVQRQWYQSGAKFKKLNLEKGREVGLQQSWRENGKIYSNYEARNGRIFGLKRANLCYELEKEIVQYKEQ